MVHRVNLFLLVCLVFPLFGCLTRESDSSAVSPKGTNPDEISGLKQPTTSDTVLATPAGKPKGDKPVDQKVIATEWAPELAARSLLTKIINGQFAAATETFDATVGAALPAEKLKTTWQTVQLQAGNYQGIARKARVQSLGPHQVVDLLCTFEKTRLRFRIAYDAKHRVAGIFFLPASPVHTDPKEKTSEAGSPDVKLPTASATLFGTIDVPEGEGPFPVLLILSGSGPNDRDGNQVTLKSDYLKKLGTALAAQGFAVLRFDKRGSGRSHFPPGREKDFRFDALVDDAVGWVSLLRKDSRFSRVGIIGHSQGSLVGMLVARRVHLDAFVSIAGPSRTIDDVIRGQLAPKLESSPDLKRRAFDIIDKLSDGQTVEEVPVALQSLFRPSVQGFLISWMKHDPARLFAAMKVPSLIVQGTRDIQVQIADAEGLKAVRPAAELAMITDMNHVLRHISDDSQQLPSYTNPKLPLEPALVPRLSTFLQKSFAGSATEK